MVKTEIDSIDKQSIRRLIRDMSGLEKKAGVAFKWKDYKEAERYLREYNFLDHYCASTFGENYRGIK